MSVSVLDSIRWGLWPKGAETNDDNGQCPQQTHRWQPKCILISWRWAMV